MGLVDTIIGSAFGSIFGTGFILGLALFAIFAYIIFRSGMSTSGIIFFGIFSLGTMTLLGYVDQLVFVIACVIGGWFVYRAAVGVTG